MPELIDGFRIGNYFISFPQGEFIKVDDNGNMFADVNVYEFDDDGKTRRLEKDEISPELNEMISNELSRMVEEIIKLDNNNVSE